MALLAKASRRPREDVRREQARRFRRLLERLGGTAIKFGQIMAMRPDFFKQEYIDELAALLDAVPAFPCSEAVAIFEEEFSTPIDTIFASFSMLPIASASFGQVHRAELLDGKPVAVKVQRPGIRELVRTDLKILRFAAGAIDASKVLTRFRMRPIYEDFARWTRDELDYSVEARRGARFGANAIDRPTELIPHFYIELCSPRILTLQYLEGFWANNVLASIRAGDQRVIGEMAAAGISAKMAAENLLRMMFKQVFADGYFHADPHAGNIVFLGDSRVGMVDFGIVGQVTDEFCRDMLRFLEYLSGEQLDRAFRAALRLLDLPSGIDIRAFQRDYEEGLRTWILSLGDPVASMEQKSAARLMAMNFNAMRKHDVGMSASTLRFYRAFSIVDSLILQLDPDLDAVAAFRRIFNEIRIERFRKFATAERYSDAALRAQVLSIELPRAASDLVEEQLRDVDIQRTAGRQALGVGVARFFSIMLIVLAILFGVFALSGTPKATEPIVLRLNWQVLALFALVLGIVVRWISRRMRSKI